LETTIGTTSDASVRTRVTRPGCSGNQFERTVREDEAPFAGGAARFSFARTRIGRRPLAGHLSSHTDLPTAAWLLARRRLVFSRTCL
jgi:hypothetical protein